MNVKIPKKDTHLECDNCKKIYLLLKCLFVALNNLINTKQAGFRSSSSRTNYINSCESFWSCAWTSDRHFTCSISISRKLSTRRKCAWSILRISGILNKEFNKALIYRRCYFSSLPVTSSTLRCSENRADSKYLGHAYGIYLLSHRVMEFSQMARDMERGANRD